MWRDRLTPVPNGPDDAGGRATEDALQRERSFIGAVLDSVPGIPYMFDAEGRLVRWNKKQEEMTGYSADELAQMRMTDWFRGDDVAYIAQRMQKVLTDGYADAEARLVTKDGTAIPFFFTGVRLILDGKTYVAGMGIDISRQKAAESAIRKSEMLYRTLFQSANDAILLIQNGVLSDCNSMATRLFGYPREQLIGHSPAAFSPAQQPCGRDSTDVAAEKIQAALEGKPQFFGWAHQRADGALLNTEISLSRLEAYAEPTLLAIVRDVTERKKTEDSLRELSQAVEQSPVNVVITDIKGDIEYANPRFCQVSGYALAEALGKNPRILKSGHTSDEEYRAMWQTITSGGEWSGEFLNKAKDGTLFLGAGADHFDQGRDRTDCALPGRERGHYRAEEGRRDVAADAVATGPRGAAFDAGRDGGGAGSRAQSPVVRHFELREGLAERACRGGPSRPGEPARMERGNCDDRLVGRRSGEALAVVCAARRVAADRLPHRGDHRGSPGACRRGVAADAGGGQHVAGRGLAAGSSGPGADSAGPGESTHQRGRGDGKRRRRRAGDRDSHFGGRGGGRGGRLRSRPGAAAGERDEDFEPFVSTKPDGLGMGLSIARTIVEAHGGRLWTTANPEGGAVFHFTLPCEAGGGRHGV